MNLKCFIKHIQDLEKSSLCGQFAELLKKYQDIILLGNGGSNAVCAHIAEDYTKVLKKRAIAFTDAARLTCYFNDYGGERAYVQFIKEFSTPKTLNILISSSGESTNIVNCADFCASNDLDMVVLSGFKKDNQLNQRAPKAELSYWVDSCEYGVVELAHETFLHSLV
jgi:D-sedoheptulose 7-phosphate isomerase